MAEEPTTYASVQDVQDRMTRSLEDSEQTVCGSDAVPIGATQGQMSALGYQQSWTFSNGSVGELYLAKQDKQILGHFGSVGSRSPVEDLVEVAPV